MVGGIDNLLSACSPPNLTSAADDRIASLATALVDARARIDAAWLAVVGELDRRQLWRRDGCRDAASWLAWRAGERRGAARRDVELAASLTDLSVVAGALAVGTVTKAKATELARATGATEDEQAELVARAAPLPVAAVAEAVDRWRHDRRRTGPAVTPTLSISRLADHAHVRATLDLEGGEHFEVAIDTAVAQLALPNDIPYHQRAAHGLVALSRFFLEHVADPPSNRAGRPTVVATANIETLAALSGGSARLDSGAYVTGDVARRLACDAGIIRLITDPDSLPLDVGRRTRAVSPAQARAVIHRDRHCRYEGCTAPPWACEIHHSAFWARDRGATDLPLLHLICWHHHALTHKLSATHDLIDRGDGRLTLRRRRSDQSDAA